MHQLKDYIAGYCKYLEDNGYNISPLPSVHYDNTPQSAELEKQKTAYYDPNDQIIVLYIHNRNAKDILRSFAHELVHHRQYLENRIDTELSGTDTTEDSQLNKIEKEAYLDGNITLRNYLDSLKEGYVAVPLTQSKLNSLIWDNGAMKSEIRERLLTIAEDFLNTIPQEQKDNIEDITLTGSLAGFAWGSQSDVDLHILVDSTVIGVGMLEYLRSLAATWNLQHNISFSTHKVELYIQDINEEHKSPGVYSLLTNKWIQQPREQNPSLTNVAKAHSIYTHFRALINNLRVLVSKEKYSAANKIAASLKMGIKNMRKAGLDREGLDSPENLAFKMLRMNGDLQGLKLATTAALDNAQSLTEQSNIIRAYHVSTHKDLSKGRPAETMRDVKLYAQYQSQTGFLGTGYYFFGKKQDAIDYAKFTQERDSRALNILEVDLSKCNLYSPSNPSEFAADLRTTTINLYHLEGEDLKEEIQEASQYFSQQLQVSSQQVVKTLKQFTTDLHSNISTNAEQLSNRLLTQYGGINMIGTKKDHFGTGTVVFPSHINKVSILNITTI